MKLLAINCGSSSLKFELFACTNETLRLAQGIVELGRDGPGRLKLQKGADKVREEVEVADHAAALKLALARLETTGLLKDSGIDAVAHRVVHGGDRFVEPTLIDEAVIAAIDELRELAPLHNTPALAALRAARSLLGDKVPMVAVFDTAFHARMPAPAATYAIPRELAKKHRIRRYGFHGIAHRFMTERHARLAGVDISSTRIITLQLGNGCSAAAVRGGRSLDTSMGFTPLEGLVMGTRSGDVDPSLAGFLAEREKVPVDEIESWLNKRSGLLGLSGTSSDMRDLLEAERQGDENAGLAVELFCYRVRKYIGSYLAVLGGADAIVFGGGIGENAAAVRQRICKDMEWCGLSLDESANDSIIGKEGRITADSARLHVYVIPVDESSIMVEDTLACLNLRENQS